MTGDAEIENVSYRYLVVPFFRKFRTRHEAVGYICWTGREFDVEPRLFTVEADSEAEELVDMIDDELGVAAIPKRLGGEFSGV